MEEFGLGLMADVAIPMRDEATLRADVWRDPSPGAFPALLHRTPYGKELLSLPSLLDPRPAVAAGFAVVFQDVRGTGKSDGSLEPYVTEGRDGADTIAWIAEQRWCDGRVAMLGPSYTGLVQWLAAGEQPPALGAIAPAMCVDQPGEGWSFYDGCREQGFLASWIAAALAPPEHRRLDDLEAALRDVESLGVAVPWARAWFAEAADAPYWRARSPRTDASVPAFLLGGWYDVFVGGTLASFARRRNPSDRLVVGPWGHDIRLPNTVGEADLGIAGAGAVQDIQGRMLRFFDAVLDGREPPGPPVLAYLLGRREWYELPDWPPPGAVVTEVALEGAGTFAVDPTDLPPSLGGRAVLAAMPLGGFGVRDQRRVADRDDVVMLRARMPGEGATVLAGPLRLRLSVQATGGETRDWVATVCIARPDGGLENLCEGIARGPVDATEVEVDLGHAFVEIPPDGELVVLVAGGSFPRWEPTAHAGVQRIHRGAALHATVVAHHGLRAP